MKIFDLLSGCNPNEMKVHFAVRNPEGENPLEYFKEGQDAFTSYQNIQTKKNFSRKYILSLVQLENKEEWLFAGIYEVCDSPKIFEEETGKWRYKYDTKLTDFYQDLIGRLVLNFKKTFRPSYPNAETIADAKYNVSVQSIREERLSVSDFKSFHETNLSRSELEIIIKHQAKDWKAALSSVAAIYLITDLDSNQLYVGSAYKLKHDGGGSLWSRWSAYEKTYHGGNKQFKLLFKEKGEIGFSKFQYSILETFDIDIGVSDITSRESEWKRRLRTVVVGFNDN